MKVQDLIVMSKDKKILKKISLDISPGEVHAIMGPNGSGKSTLAATIMGSPKYETKGKILWGGQNILELSPANRSKLGIFLAFQYPQEIPGLKVSTFLYSMAKVHKQDLSAFDFRKQMLESAKVLKIEESFLDRELNVGFSGGEKKRLEMLQMLILKPKLAILDETDSGLDVDSLKIVSNGLNSLRGKGFSALIITHYPRILHHINPDKVHILVNGNIVQSGDFDLALKIEKNGYKEYGAE